MSYTKYLAGVLLEGPIADRPAASAGTYWYLADDVAGGTLYHSTGSAWVQVAAGVSGGGAGTVTDVSSTNTSIAVANGTTTPALTVATLDVLAANGPPAAAVAMNAEKITGLANGSSAQDAAAFGQIPTALPPDGSAGGDLSGTYPDPSVAKINGTALGTLSGATNGQALVWDAGSSSWLPATVAGSSPLTTKGDVYGFSTVDARIPVGSDGQVLTADSAQTLGLKWATAGTSGVSSFNTRTGAVTLAAGDVEGLFTATGQVFQGTGSGSGALTLPPGYEIGYDQITSPVTVSSATESSGTTVISCGAHTFDGAAVMVEFFCVAGSVGTTALVVNLFEGSTQITRLSEVNATANMIGPYRFTPSAGSHTYTVTAYKVGANNGTINCGAGGTGAYPPAFVRFTKV